MSKESNLQSILAEFENAFSKEARSLIIHKISDDIYKKEGPRIGDILTELDDLVYKTYEPIAKRNRMLILSEENSDILVSYISASELNEYKYLLILDSIDGSVNMLNNLVFGTNIAFGTINHDKKKFTIGDIEAVFVAEFLSKRAFKWIKGSHPIIQPAVYEGEKWRKNRTLSAQVFEVPDSKSYETPSYTERIIYQERLLKLFRSIFKGKQRRAVDCTGLRMLEICEKNILAYGDVRGATRLWDSIPSLRYLLEFKAIKTYDYRLKEYNLDMPIFSLKNGLVHFHTDLGNSMIIILKEFESRILQEKAYIVTGKWKDEPKVGKAKVFIVFGHDRGDAFELKSFLRKKGFDEPIMLEEKPFRGRTIIEKFEEETADVGLVFVLLTPDDIVLSKTENGQESRARENVIFELGYFYGKFSRKSGQVIPLYKGNTNIFSDFLGIGYIDITNGIKSAIPDIEQELEGGKWL